ncbi:MAG: DUF2244 domain-containing protein [Lachnospiraceae bacterium]|nr:DUF2244 domain-containing protein [Lachnospiraceae bacterium]
MKEKKYYMGKRFYRYRTLAMALCFFVIGVFYCLYDEWMVPVVPALQGVPMLLIFAGLEVLVLGGIYVVSKRMAECNYYVVRREGLLYVSGEKQIMYPWEDFESMQEDRFDYAVICPIQYTVAGKPLMLNQYLEDIWGLHRDILAHLGGRIPVPEQLREQVQCMS